MDREQIVQRLSTMLQERFNVDLDSIRGDTRRAELGIDSILMLDLMLDIETEMNITFRDLDLPSNPSIDDVVNLIEANLDQGSAA